MNYLGQEVDRGCPEGPRRVKATSFPGEGQSPSARRFISLGGHQDSKESSPDGKPGSTLSTPELRPI